MDENLLKEISGRIKNGGLACADAFDIAASLGVEPKQVGAAADSRDVSLTDCRLGLFGHSPDKKIVRPQQTSDRTLMDAIRDASGENGLDCAEAWKIAERFGIPKLKVAHICEGAGIKFRSCQLGAF
eukprot:NODE_440_length_915_cov_2.494949_g432_i0.p1 GENE.NODE_440_length_915_cov_2.494949_g432_i0~~NODE_440_length_915_cov_2.494949_g432_i0.p1  ORF type:complete len:127 (-),score=33.43 NODE_440_length_915_cov_2.494949_g432_i0:386-766(-)